MGMILDDARAAVLLTGGAAGVATRLALCADILEQRKRAKAPFDSDKERARAASLIERRVHAIRAMLLPSFESGKGAGAVDTLLTPSLSVPTLMEQLQAVQTGAPHEKVAASLYASELVAMLRAVNTAEMQLGLTNKVQGMPEVVALADSLLEAEPPDGTPEWQVGYTHALPVVTASLDAGKLSAEHQELLQSMAQDAERAVIGWPVEEPELFKQWQGLEKIRLARQDVLDSLLAQFNNTKLPTSRRAAAGDKFNETRREFVKWLQESYEAVNNKAAEVYQANKRKAEETKQKLQEQLFEPLLQESPISEQQASQWVERNAVIEPAAAARLTKMGYPPDQVRRDMTEFYRFVRGRLDKLRIVTNGRKRAAAGNIMDHGMPGVIYLGKRFDKRVLWHEMGHHLEADPAAAAAARLYIRMRTKAAQLVRLMDVRPNHGYGSDEVALQTDFFDPYVGKVYSSGATELFSMGVESFSDPALLAYRMSKDPATLQFVLGYLRNPQTALAQMHQAMREAMRTSNEDMDESQEQVVRQKLEALASRVTLVADSGPWWERVGIRLGGDSSNYIGYVQVGSDNPEHRIYVHKAKVTSPKTRRDVQGFRLFTVAERGSSSFASLAHIKDLETRDQVLLRAYLAVWADSLATDWDAYPPSFYKLQQAEV